MQQTKPTPLFALTLGCVGVVYGDIGTSPLYAFREALGILAGHGNSAPITAIFGLLSLIVWSLVIIVTGKYMILLLRADNNGEGGILSLMALGKRVQSARGSNTGWLVFLGISGAALFYGDAIITPAISVLSAVEGLKLVTKAFDPYVVPLAIAVLIVLFIAQRHGTEKVAVLFGPIMTLWFVMLAVGGLRHIADYGDIWQAIDPRYAVRFIAEHGTLGLMALGGVFLAVTGAEALYADLGHFGKAPIRVAWIALVMPALILNYFGQAALVIHTPSAAASPFFLLYPDWALLPMVILSTLATVIASQAVISGAFSLAQQAVQLGLLPRMHIRYTSDTQRGQIYVDKVNWWLMGSVILLIELFRTSSNLAAAYGIAVTATMVITTLLAVLVMRSLWQWHWLMIALIAIPLLMIEFTFLGANLTKFFEGGYLPIVIAVILIVMMRTWIRGNATLREQETSHLYTVEGIIHQLRVSPPARVEGTAIYLSSRIDGVPLALLQNLKHNKVLHMHNIVLTLQFDTLPYADASKRLRLQPIDRDFTRIVLTFGFMETPDVPKALAACKAQLPGIDIKHASYFISHREIVPSAGFGMPLWRDKIFITLAKTASDPTDYFHLPPSSVVELGVQMTV